MDRSRLRRFINQPLDEFPLSEPTIVAPQDPVRTVVGRLQEGASSCVVVVDGQAVAGILTERDVLTRCMVDGFNWDQPVGNVITTSPRVIGPRATVGEAVAVMQQLNCRTLPVVLDGRILGIVRAGDLLRDFAEAFPEDVLNLPPRPHQVMEKQEGG